MYHMYLLASLLLIKDSVKTTGAFKSGHSLWRKLLATLLLLFFFTGIAAANNALIQANIFAVNGSLWTTEYRVTNITSGPPVPFFGIREVVFRNIESITPPSFPGFGTNPGQNPPGWVPSFTLIEDGPEIDVYEVRFISSNPNAFFIGVNFQDQFYWTVRGPLNEAPVLMVLPESLYTSKFNNGASHNQLVPVLDFDDAPPPLTPPVLDNMTVSGSQICFDISNMTIGALITIQGNENITNPTGWSSIESFSATTTPSNRCNPIGSATFFRAKAQ